MLTATATVRCVHGPAQRSNQTGKMEPRFTISDAEMTPDVERYLVLNWSPPKSETQFKSVQQRNFNVSI